MVDAVKIRVCSVLDTDVGIHNSKAGGDAVLAAIAMRSEPAQAKPACAAPGHPPYETRLTNTKCDSSGTQCKH
jgi:hypothetical protein